MIVEDAFEGESVEPAGFSDVLDSIGAEDVEGAAAQPGEDAWIDANATSILGHGDVADVVGTVLDAPMATDRIGEGLGGKAGGGDVPGGLLAFGPQAGGGTAEPGGAGDAGANGEIRRPGCPREGASQIEGLDEAILLPVAALVVAPGGVQDRILAGGLAQPLD